MITAEKDKFMKALNIELSDILSMEPVDQRLRPLRLHTDIWKNEDDYDLDEGETIPSSQFLYLKPKIKSLLS